MSFDTITLHCFIAVAETLSFTKAAERVGRTQSAVSQQISKLEGLLNKPLIERGKILTLTPEGHILLSYARQLFSLHREVIDRFKEPELEGEVRFGLPENFATTYLSDVLANFLRIHPRIFLNIECALTLNLFERFKKNEFDIVLVKMNRPEDFPNGVEVWSEPLKWVGDESLVSLNKPLPLLLSPEPCVYRASAIKALEKMGRSWRLVFSSPSHASTVAATKAGMGITVMPQAMVPKELDVVQSTLLPVLDDSHVSLLKHNGENPAVNTLENYVLKRLKQ